MHTSLAIHAASGSTTTTHTLPYRSLTPTHACARAQRCKHARVMRAWMQACSRCVLSPCHSLSPAQQSLASYSDEGAEGEEDVCTEQQQGLGDTAQQDEGEDSDEGWEGDEYEEEDYSTEEEGSGISSSSSHSLKTLLQGTLLPEVFAELCADGRPPEATYTRVKTAEYISSCVAHNACPVAPKFPEFAVIGRSNVGKSSLINMLTGSRRLAKVSKEPGKTQCINHFLINNSWYLVDLPGFGYAKRNSVTRSNFETFTKDYFLNRTSLAMVYLLVDCSISPQRVDLQYASWLYENKVPFSIIFTKADKRRKKRSKHDSNTFAFKQALLQKQGLPALPPCIITSAEKGIGRTPTLHLTACLRQVFQASGILDRALLEWQRAQIGATHTTDGADSGAFEAVPAATPPIASDSGVSVSGDVGNEGESQRETEASSGAVQASSIDGEVGASEEAQAPGEGRGESDEGVSGAVASSSGEASSSSSSSIVGFSEAEIRARIKQRSQQRTQQQGDGGAVGEWDQESDREAHSSSRGKGGSNKKAGAKKKVVSRGVSGSSRTPNQRR